MRVGSAFPSKYLKAEDLNGRDVTVTISKVKMESIGQNDDEGEKLVIYFEGKQKGMVCNRTNANKISSAYGDETDDWVGCQITLYETEVEFSGRSVPAIRVKIPPRSRREAPQQKRETDESNAEGGGKRSTYIDKTMDEEIPF